jgi:hypothetical protein
MKDVVAARVSLSRASAMKSKTWGTYKPSPPTGEYACVVGRAVGGFPWSRAGMDEAGADVSGLPEKDAIRG